MIDYDTFLDWAKDRFPDCRVKRGEIRINSIFTADRKFKLYCNPKKNAYHCWKTGESGNLVQLVAHVDGIALADAARLLGINNPLRHYEERMQELEEMFRAKGNRTEPPSQIELPPSTFLIESLSDMSPHKKGAIAYLTARKIPVTGMYVCTAGKEYRERIIIPYRNRCGSLIYWNGRDYKGQTESRYRGPDREMYKTGKEDVIYFYNWPKGKNRVMLTEGEFDAISLTISGLCGAACGGKVLFDKQLEYLEGMPICLAFDNDERGVEALHNVGTRLLREGSADLTYVRPPKGFKDWNQMLVERGTEVISAYAKRYERPFDQWTSISARGK